jgi:DNA gyrase subunit A
MIGQKNALMAVVQSVAEPLKSSSEDPSTPLLHHMDGRAHGPSAPPLTLRPLLPLLLLLLLLLSPRSMMAPRSGVAIASALLLRSTSVLAFHSFAGPFSPAAGVGVQQRRWVASKGGGTDAGKRRGALSMAGPSKGRRRARPKSYALQQSSSDADEGLSASAGGTAVLDGDMADKGVMPVELTSELGSSFMQYAMSIILGRALPDARDGLKPVHRRILYAMHGLGLQPDSSYRKCARVVGEVLGKYHPHGDVAVYDALVRMSQDFVMGTPLVSGHGNFGSIDNDPPAAMRYTEAKLAPMARDGLLLDIALDTVDFVPNFDGNEEEPVVLPARVPMLLLNGATGIAVGMATNVPPHNLGELIAATARLIKDPQTSDNELFRLVPAPDFPTGGSIMGLAGARKMYTTSNGGITIRATTRIEAMGKGGQRSAIIVTEMPYMVNKAGLLEKIAAMVNDKKLEGISDLRDESDRDGIRVVIELKRDAVPQVVLNNLYQKTQLQTQFSANLLALGGGGTQPQRFTLRGALQAFIDFRFETLRRRTSFELSKVTARDHIVQGMLLALSKIDSVIEVVRGAKSSAEAREALMGDAYGLSHEQAEAILGLRLGRLTAMEEEKLKREHEDLTAEIARLGKLMQDDGATNELMISELEEIKRKHAVPRRTILKPDEGT